jgi:hypothetical protein
LLNPGGSDGTGDLCSLVAVCGLVSLILAPTWKPHRRQGLVEAVASLGPEAADSWGLWGRSPAV